MCTVTKKQAQRISENDRKLHVTVRTSRSATLAIHRRFKINDTLSAEEEAQVN